MVSWVFLSHRSYISISYYDTDFDVDLKDDDILNITKDEAECNFELKNIVFHLDDLDIEMEDKNIE